NRNNVRAVHRRSFPWASTKARGVMISTAPKNFMRSQVVIASDDEAGLGGLGTLHRCHKGGRNPPVRRRSWLSMRSKTFWGTPPKTRKCRRWSPLRFWSLGLFLADLADLGALLHAVFANQAGHIVLGDAEGLGLGPGNGVNLLPVLLGGYTFNLRTSRSTP